LPPVILGALFAPEVIALFYGDGYSPAALAMPWLLLAEIPVVAGIVYGHFSLAAKLQRYDVVFTLITAIANVSLCFWLIPKLGLTGAAAGSLVSYSISIPVQLVFRSTRSYSAILFREAFRVLVVVLLAWLAFVAAERILPGSISVLVSILVSLGAAVLVKLIRKDDLRWVSGLVFA
jgi:O-antigen/teichoic acid export membrane protein